ncbi:MAG: RnfABCDGE type electron transport complex subunit B [Coriobacteriia bacterium]|nr:RnfABCDGE type electron transport complex subunit B [Coriobacteriia bacterium]
MDLALVLKAIVALSIIGIAASFMLAIASRRFAVEIDPRIERVLAALPGANCGACGNPSCFSAAEAIVTGGAPVTLCTAGGQVVVDAVAAALGVEPCEVSSAISLRACGGGGAATRRYAYSGIMSCNAVSRVAGGDLVCPTGCLGYGDCKSACPFGAISMDGRGLPVIDPDTCTGCEVCIRECPRGGVGLLSMAPAEGSIAVRCCSHDRPRERKSYCSMCCIACKKCEKACPVAAIKVVDMLAVVDYDLCIGCGRCVIACPQKCIDLHGRTTRYDLVVTEGAGPDVGGFKPMSDEEAASL